MFKSSEITAKNNWNPFLVDPLKTDVIRPMAAAEGVADRLRLVAFAELQARDAFFCGAERYSGIANSDWVKSWREFAAVEDRHAQILLDRMAELGVNPGSRRVSNKLIRLCEASTDPVLFLFLLSSAEERGMEAGQILGAQMGAVDKISASIFEKIAAEEVEHVETAKKYLAPYQNLDLRGQARSLSQLLQI